MFTSCIFYPLSSIFELWKAHESWNYIKQTHKEQIKQTHKEQVRLRKQYKIWQHWANARETMAGIIETFFCQ